jgi:predicted ester cyclase
MSIQENKALIWRAVEEVWNKKNIALFDEYHAMGHAVHEDWKHWITTELWVAFPDLHFTLERQIAEGDLVASHFTLRATHLGPWKGIPPTGKQVVWSGVSMDQVVAGKIVNHWSGPNFLNVVERLGARITLDQG